MKDTIKTYIHIWYGEVYDLVWFEWRTNPYTAIKAYNVTRQEWDNQGGE